MVGFDRARSSARRRWSGSRRAHAVAALLVACLAAGAQPAIGAPGGSPAQIDPEIESTQSGTTPEPTPETPADGSVSTETESPASLDVPLPPEDDPASAGDVEDAPQQPEPAAPDTTPAATEEADTPSAIGVETSGVESMSNLPVVDITLDYDVTLAQLNAPSRDTFTSRVRLDDPATEGTDLDAAGVEIRGRGNFTWGLEKKPYQIKFEKKTSILGMEKSKTWVLLANHADVTLMRNKLLYDLAGAIGLEYSPESQFVDVLINGEYLGNYLLSEKTEVKEERVNLKHPQGVLVELDNLYGAQEDHYFRSARSGTLLVLSDNEDDPEVQAGFQEFESHFNRLEALLYATDPDWNTISELIDVDSFVKYYFVTELGQNSDAGHSSVYFYKDGPDDVLHIGPVWDYDIALANFSSTQRGGNPTENYTKNLSWIRGSGSDLFRLLFRNPEFVSEANEMYDTVVVNEEHGTTIRQELQKVSGHVTELQDVLAQSAEANFQRWDNVLGRPAPFGDRVFAGSYDSEVNRLKSWLDQRLAYLDGHYGTDMPILTYSPHVQRLGWLPGVTGGMRQGTTGQALRLEAMKIGLVGGPGGTIEVNSHVQSLGWTGWANSSEGVGTTGRGLRLEALQLRLTGALADQYDIYYRVHSQSHGWLGWARNGETAGTVGYALRVEAVEVQLVRAGTTINGTSGPAVIKPPSPPSIVHQGHVQTIGWQQQAGSGSIVGTTGRALRLEAARFSLVGATGGIEYRSHVQRQGWTGYVSNGTTTGSVGQALRLEAIELRLTGDAAAQYDVYYRAHSQSFGWLGWAKNGAPAGTAGHGLRMEALQIALVPKNGPAPGAATRSFVQK